MTRPGLAAAARERVLVCDGAMGTMLQRAGLAMGACGVLWNVERPAAVRQIHAAYAEAGCDLLTTNTFGGSPAALEGHGLRDRTAELNRAGAALAREAAGDARWVLGDIGPFGGLLEPFGDVTAAQLRGEYAEQARALLEGGADALLVETMSDPEEAVCAIHAAREAGAREVLATFAFQHAADGGFRTMMGTTVDEALGRAVEAGASGVGANCGTALGFEDYARLAEALVKAARGAVAILQPNAGAPRLVDGAAVYDATPAEMAGHARRWMEAGVRIIGGCCGTTPGHLAALAAVAGTA